jgi:hypothetical protein
MDALEAVEKPRTHDFRETLSINVSPQHTEHATQSGPKLAKLSTDSRRGLASPRTERDHPSNIEVSL